MEKKKILIVEDEEEMVKLLTMRLEISGYEVFKALNGNDGLREAQNIRPDMIILDLMLPGMGGYEICTRLKNDRQLSDIPVLIYSARGGDVDRTMGFQCGANDYMVKPFDGEVLLNKIENLLQARS